jgi:putative ABC transport system permease protein
VLRDLKIAVRHLLKSPGFSATAVLMLTLGIGATTAIFSIVEGVLLRPLPFPNPNALVVVSDAIKGAEINGDSEAGVTAADIVNYTRDTQSFAALGGYQQNGNELSGAGEPAQINDACMIAGVFAALGVQPLLGRVFTTEEDTGGAPVAVLSYATWQSRFHGDAGMPGSSAAKFFSIANLISSSESCRAALSFPFSPGI